MRRFTFGKDEWLTLLALVSDLDPSIYASPLSRSVIEKCKAFRACTDESFEVEWRAT